MSKAKDAIDSTAVAVGRIKLGGGGHGDVGKHPQPSTSGADGMPWPDATSKALFKKLITRAKQEQERGNLQKALERYKEARKLYPSEKVDKKIMKIEAFLSDEDEETEEEEEEDDGTVTVTPGFNLPKDLSDKLYPYQQEGVRWFYRLFTKGKGGILADDMGLGKTIQVSAFLCGMFLQDKIRSVLIILPVAVITNWEKELEKCRASDIWVTQFYSNRERNPRRERTKNLERVQRRGGIVLTTYGMLLNSWEQLSSSEDKEFVWDYVILDEGHKIKNPNNKTTKHCYAIPAKNRIILTGTPVQNNLQEMWALFDFVSQGTLLGTAKTFKMEYENPITRARERDATAGEIRLGNQMSESLRTIVAPYFLRRTKDEVMPKDKDNADPNADSQGAQAIELATGSGFPSLERKNDFILWVVLCPTQQKIYRDFLRLDRVKKLLATTKSPLADLTILKKICDHPRLLPTLACAQLGLNEEDGMNPEDVDNMAHEVAANSIENISTEQLMAESAKTSVLVELLMRLREEGHQTLVFSHSSKMLDIIQKILKSRGFKIIRIDGTVKLEGRDKRIHMFQNDPSWSVFLLTTQVGGEGLNLTAADRVIIYDPSWNPATDAQVVDRAYRIGQKKSVVIYRFITCGTVEEKMYKRQVFKESVTKQTMGACKDPFRYFSRQDLRELFVMDNPEHSTTQQQLAEMHSHSRNSDTTLDEHIVYLHTLAKKEKAHVSSDDNTDSSVHPKTSPPVLPGDFINLCQETEEEQAQQLEKSFAKISISSQEKEEEEMVGAAQADQDDAEDTDLQLALAMSLSQSVVQGDGHNTQVGGANSSNAHASTNKAKAFVVDSDEEDSAREQQSSRCSSGRPVIVIEDSDPDIIVIELP